MYANLQEKAGFSQRCMELPDDANITTLKSTLENQYPQLRAHLDNILVLIESKSAVDEDYIPPDSTVMFLTPIGGG